MNSIMRHTLSEKKWKPSNRYLTVVEANRLFYAQTAYQYDSTECCVTDKWFQTILDNDIDRIVNFIDKAQTKIRVLDACGGSGNVALKLLRRNVHVTLVDVSPDLLRIYEKRCSDHDYTSAIVNSEIGEYLNNSKANFDLIVFSSALHHLEDIDGILSLAFHRLREGGFLFSIFDPTVRADQSSFAKAIMWMDYVVFKAINRPKEFRSSARRCLGNVFNRNFKKI